MPNILSDAEIDRIGSKAAIQTVGKRILSALYSTFKRQMILLDGHKTKGAGKQTEPARRLRPFRHPCFFLILFYDYHSFLSSMFQSTEKGPLASDSMLSNRAARAAALLFGSSRDSSAQ